MSNIWFYNENCFDTMQRMVDKDYKVDIVLTSPPYNTSKKRGTWSKEQKYHYDLKEIDSMTEIEYREFSVNLFKYFDKILNNNGVVLWNMSYSTDKPFLVYQCINDIMENSNFVVSDTIIWKKKSALPNNMSCNRLTRICEFIFVFCRENELKTFNMNKEILSTRPNGIKQYTTYYNFIEAKNNNGSCKLNKATFSTDLVKQLLQVYAKSNSKIYDPFMGTGTTAIACEEMGFTCFGSELSEAQVQYSKERLEDFRNGK